MYLERETADELLQEEHGRIRRLLLKCRNKAKACAFVNRCILVHLFALLFCLSDNAGSGNDFNINLDLFTGEGCLLIWFWLIYRFLLGRTCFQPEAFHAAVKTSNSACIPFFTRRTQKRTRPVLGRRLRIRRMRVISLSVSFYLLV